MKKDVIESGGVFTQSKAVIIKWSPPTNVEACGSRRASFFQKRRKAMNTTHPGPSSKRKTTTKTHRLAIRQRLNFDGRIPLDDFCVLWECGTNSIQGIGTYQETPDGSASTIWSSCRNIGCLEHLCLGMGSEFIIYTWIRTCV